MTLGVPAAMLASIPSPSESIIQLGPLRLTAYGLMIALGVIAAYEVARRRWAARGGDPDDVAAIAIWAVPAGLIGARLYHVVTDWNRLYADAPGDVLKIWDGGLGIPGGILAGVVVGLVVGHRRGMRLPVGLDAFAPALPLAQAIGRLGNWWNQELYGRPTDLPWGLEIDLEHRQAGYEVYETFHPTFLYEGLWNLALFAFLIWIDRRRVLRPGRVFALYVGGYALGRLWVESVRIDTASEILGLRVNIWMSIVVLVAVVLFLAIGGLRRRPGDDDDPYVDGHRFVSGHHEEPEDRSAAEPNDPEPGSEHPGGEDPGSDEAAVGDGSTEEANGA
jgi:prolipoprotein diacylglyceryl transferase